MKNASIEAWVSVLMFLRLYLLGRVIVMHSSLFESPSSQSLGALNHVHLNNRFVWQYCLRVFEGICDIENVNDNVFGDNGFRKKKELVDHQGRKE